MATYPFLSDEWMAEVRRIRDEYAGRVTPPERAVRMNQVVTDVPFGDGTVELHLDVSGGRAHLDLGRLNEPEITVIVDYETARAILVGLLAQDAQPAVQAFMSGRMRIQGDLAKLMTMLQPPEETPDPLAGEVAARIREITA